MRLRHADSHMQELVDDELGIYCTLAGSLRSWARYLRGNVLWGHIQINIHVHDDFFLLRMQVGAVACTAVTCICEFASLVVENEAAFP